jgi:hypothetical protein
VAVITATFRKCGRVKLFKKPIGRKYDEKGRPKSSIINKLRGTVG